MGQTNSYDAINSDQKQQFYYPKPSNFSTNNEQAQNILSQSHPLGYAANLQFLAAGLSPYQQQLLQSKLLDNNSNSNMTDDHDDKLQVFFDKDFFIENGNIDQSELGVIIHNQNNGKKLSTSTWHPNNIKAFSHQKNIKAANDFSKQNSKGTDIKNIELSAIPKYSEILQCQGREGNTTKSMTNKYTPKASHKFERLKTTNDFTKYSLSTSIMADDKKRNSAISTNGIRNCEQRMDERDYNIEDNRKSTKHVNFSRDRHVKHIG